MTQDQTLLFAREELDAYLTKWEIKADITLAVADELGLSLPVANQKLDDAIAIEVKGRKGYIAGTNARSVLIGVYRLLSEWGVRWVRPGKNGTFCPPHTDAPDVSITEYANKRHRTMCIEGAVSLENVLDMIAWLPKVGMNGYYIQFHDAFIFFDRFYGHRGNPLRTAEPFGYDKALQYVDIMVREIKRRGLLLHRMGHGWTCEPFGIPNHGWDPVDPATFPAEYIRHCALVKGERKVWRNMPIATQLCYSDPVVQKTITHAVVQYAQEHPETDVIHFWMGDFFNNTCECANCTKYRYSDYVTVMVNEITALLQEKGLDTQIVFSCGYNQAHPPIHEQLHHPERTMLMFAPISRTFAASFPNGYQQKEIPPYAVNAFDNPRSVDENLAYLYQWQQYYHGDVVDFDYHLMWDHLLDAGGEGIARVLHDDIQHFDALGIDSFISCQLQRNSFPTSIAMTVMAKTLWNQNTDMDAVRQELYTAAFGADMAERMKDYFSTLSRGFSIGAIRSQVPIARDTFCHDLQEAVAAMDGMAPVIEEQVALQTDPCRRESWELLAHHARIYGTLGRSILASLAGNKEEGERLRAASVRIAWECEDAVQGALDCHFYDEVTRERINLDGPTAFFDF